MRLFFAIELPAEVQAALGRLRPPGSHEYRWVAPALLHVTLAFLGEQPIDRLEALQAVARSAARESRGGVLRLGQPGSFGPPRAPRVLWIGLDGDVQQLLELQAALDGALRVAGFRLEDRQFRPHITLARRRESASWGTPPCWPPAERAPDTAFALRALTLFHSRLSPRGPSYLPLFELPVGQAAPG